MNRLFLILYFSFIACISIGQVEKEIHQVLLKRDFKQFIRIAEKYLPETGTYIASGVNREITGEYREMVFYVKKSYPHKSGVRIGVSSRLEILTESDRIIYFNLECKEMKNFPETFKTDDTLFTYSDNKRIEAMQLSFENSFLAPFNEKELFIDSIYYGSKCGHNGDYLVPEQRQIATWVRNIDTTNLRLWLQSTNTEKQVYAVQGYNSLSQMGYQMNDGLMNLIRMVKQKKGTINTCIPCDSGPTEISLIVSRFK